jgi:hypothetical protein
MADFLHGKDTIVELDTVDISDLVNTTGIDTSVEDGDVTTFADAARRFIPGLKDNGEITLEGPYSKDLLDAVLAAEGVAGSTLRITAGGGAAGMPYVEADGFVNKVSCSFDVGDPAAISATFKVDGELTHDEVSA